MNLKYICFIIYFDKCWSVLSRSILFMYFFTIVTAIRRDLLLMYNTCNKWLNPWKRSQYPLKAFTNAYSLKNCRVLDWMLHVGPRRNWSYFKVSFKSTFGSITLTWNCSATALSIFDLYITYVEFGLLYWLLWP